MKPDPLACPYAEYTDGMKIDCGLMGGRCGHQRFKPCVGWWVLTDQARDCTIREGVKSRGGNKDA